LHSRYLETNSPSKDSFFFLWLVSNNKLLTRDNLDKMRKVEDLTCLFCKEKEHVHHLLFECVVARRLDKPEKLFLKL
jgi:hypothetical protein